MQMLHVSNYLRMPLVSVPPMYTWPKSLKKAVLTLAIIACLGAYLLLTGGVVGAAILLLQTLLG
ncbi:MAG: hypothetical protein JXM69_08710 [Anaerolineae bacterium]|nr:hypothetical protein [Anaerolineae bacterium]